jgi:hypothetical protein
MAAAVLAAAVFALAWGSPNQDVDSDPAIALLSSQALLDHGTLRLDGYAGDPACAYDLTKDRRVRRQGGSYAYYNVGVPLLSVPAVWVANRFGFHMLDQRCAAPRSRSSSSWSAGPSPDPRRVSRSPPSRSSAAA